MKNAALSFQLIRTTPFNCGSAVKMRLKFGVAEFASHKHIKTSRTEVLVNVGSDLLPRIKIRDFHVPYRCLKLVPCTVSACEPAGRVRIDVHNTTNLYDNKIGLLTIASALWSSVYGSSFEWHFQENWVGV